MEVGTLRLTLNLVPSDRLTVFKFLPTSYFSTEHFFTKLLVLTSLSSFTFLFETIRFSDETFFSSDIFRYDAHFMKCSWFANILATDLVSLSIDQGKDSKTMTDMK